VITSIMFVRHGETLWNQQRRYQGQADSPLSELGLAQAELVGKFLSSRRIDAVYTSDLGRAVQTADCIAKHHGLSAIADSRLREMSFGIWEGLTREEVMQEHAELFYARMKDNLSHPVPEGEGPEEVVQRFLSCLEERIAQHEGGTIVVVSHGAALRMVIASLLHIPLGKSQCLRQSNGGISELAYDRESRSCPWQAVTINCTAHLH
jgi:broad specificity phosphatase PhoE